MVRCPMCGIRLDDAGPVCPQHGPAPVVAPTPNETLLPAEYVPPRLPDYHVSALLGLGGFGAVFRAERARDGRPVAIKVARADRLTASERLLTEAAALRVIGPPHVPEVFATGTLPDGAAFMVLEFVRAPTLATVLTELRGPLFTEQFQRIALALVDLVALVHQKGFVHCDLKPENVFVTTDLPEAGSGVKLFDFGLVRMRPAKKLARTETPREGAEVRAELGRQEPIRQESERPKAVAEVPAREEPEGTPEYMSPEQCEGDGGVDARSDVYALGVMLYEMLTGAPPFWGNSAEVQLSHRSHRPPSPSRRVPVSESLESLILRCLTKSPARRFADATELGHALRAAFGKGNAKEPTPGRPMTSTVTGGTSAGDDATAKTKAPAAVRERRAVAMVSFETKSPVAAVRGVLAATGGQLAHTAGIQYVIVLGHEVGDNPTRSAVQAAQLLLDRGLCRRALVDLASVSIQARPDGTRRYQSPLFARKEQYPSESDPVGVLVSKAACDVLPDVDMVALPGKSGFSIVNRADNVPEITAMRAGVAPLVGRDEVLRKLLDSARRVAGAAGSGAGLAAAASTGMGMMSTGTGTRTGMGTSHSGATTGTGTAPGEGRASLHGRPTIVTIIGTPGAGKTHLAAGLAQHLQTILPPMRVLMLRAKEVLGGAGDQTTREFLRLGMGLPNEAPADLGRAIVEERLGRDSSREAWAAVAVVMGWVSPDHADVAWLSAAPGALRAAAARAVGEALRGLSRSGPLALLLDDAHFADETVLDAIEYATLREGGYPIWAAVLARPGFGKGRTAWASRAAERLNLELGPLDPSAASDLARRLLSPAENVSAEALRRLTERTQGIPLLLVELVRGLKRDGLVRRSEKTGAWFLATDELERLPDLPLVQWLASRETESLPPDLAGHARLAAVLGSEFTAEELEGVMQWLDREGVSPETQLDAAVGIDRLTDAGVLVRHREGRVGFRHSLLRETVYLTVSPAQREITHRAAYGFYAEHTSLPEDRRLPAMALHAARSGLKNEAADTYLYLAQKAERRHAYLDAELLFDHAIQNLVAIPDVPVADGRQIRARRGLGTMRFRLGRYEDALKELSTAREAAHVAAVLESEIDLLLEESLVLDWLKDWTKAALLAEQAQELAVGVHDPLIGAKLIYAQGRTLHRADKTDQACAYFEKSATLAESLGVDGYEIHVLSLGLAGWGYSMSRRFAEAENTFARLISLTESRGDMLNLTMALSNRCIVSMLSFQTERMLEDYRRVIAISRETGFPLIECTSSKDLGEVYHCLGQEEEAEAQARQAIAVAQQVTGRRSSQAVIAQLLLARVLVYRGRVPETRDVLAEIEALQAEARAAGEVGLEWSPADQLLSDSVKLVIEGAADLEWERVLARAEEIMMQPQDLVEMMELRVLSCTRMKRVSDARHFWKLAVNEATRNAEIALGRLRKLEPLLGANVSAVAQA